MYIYIDIWYIYIYFLWGSCPNIVAMDNKGQERSLTKIEVIMFRLHPP